MKILVGVDASAHCRGTLATLLRMSWPRGTHVVLVSAVAPAEHLYAPEPHVVASAGGAIGLIEEDHVKTHEELATRMRQMLEEAGFETSTRVHTGDVAHVLVEEARRQNADLIVVGCHGRNGINRLLRGSVASQVAAHAPCDVLVVRREEAR